MKFLRESLHSIFPGRFRSRESLNGNFLSSREAFPEAAALLLILIKSEFHEEEKKKKEEEGEKRRRGEGEKKEEEEKEEGGKGEEELGKTFHILESSNSDKTPVFPTPTKHEISSETLAFSEI
ncbi:hypothetical protein HZH66_012433 [Vespula vulgaris]|uniref:Uncharacterized protein n=1 Tax=Vespula vulgaris TaxID=7454 RepID=A0A834MV78_VESVU|nr:hypothetical protein HZH66_012433 [Vespula vulgaris]